MESEDWECICGTSNAPNADLCEECETERPLQNQEPIIINPILDVSDQNYQTKKPLQLFSIVNDNIRLNHESLSKLEESFRLEKPICVINVAGHLGVGKTTWLNRLLCYMEDEVNDDSKMFKVGHSQQTETEGLWIYPYPLTFRDNDIQYLLIDMEGTEGFWQGNAQAHESAIKKLFFLVLTLSSVFTLHTGIRVDAQTIERLEEALSIATQLKEKTQIALPDILIMIQDCKNPRTKNGESFETFLKREWDTAKRLGENLRVIGRPKPCHEFLEILNNGTFIEAYDALGDDEINDIEIFLKYCSRKPKVKPGCREPMYMRDFIESTKKHAEIINSDQYRELFKETLDQEYVELIQPIKEIILAKYETDAETLVSNFPLEKELVDFQAELSTLRLRTKESFTNEIKKKLSIDIEKNRSITREMAHFTVSLKNNHIDISFLFRKSQHTNAQKQQEYLNQIAQLKRNSEGTNKALETLAKESKLIKTALDEKIKGLQLEQAKKETQHKIEIEELQWNLAKVVSGNEYHLAKMTQSFEAERTSERDLIKFKSEAQVNKQKANDLERELIAAEVQIANLSQCQKQFHSGKRCPLQRGHTGRCPDPECQIF